MKKPEGTLDPVLFEEDGLEPSGDLHITVRSTHPVALCGHTVKSKWGEQVETAGRDRCALCFAIAQKKYGGFRA